MKFRTGLLLGTTLFIAGIGLGPQIQNCIRSDNQLTIQALAEDVKKNQVQNNSAETYRLLTLFGDVFERVRAGYVEPVADKDLITNALNGMLTGLDPHSSYMTEKQFANMQIQTKGEFGGLGLEVQEDEGHIKVVSPIDGTPAARAGIKPGDYIIAIDGKNIDGMTLNAAVDKMRGKPKTQITLTLIRLKEPKPIKVTLIREIIHIQVIKSALYDRIGYIRISQFNEETEKNMRQAFDKLQKESNHKLAGLVIDLRNDPGGLLDQAISVSRDFIKEGAIVSTKARNPKDNQRWNAKGKDITNGLPIVVLINGGSASASEIVSGALQDHHRAVLVGEKTFGKGSVQSVMPIPGNGAIRLTIARYYTPSGRSIQGLGISPDIKVQDSYDTPEFSIREADLNHIIKNEGGNQTKAPIRNDLPAIAKSIPAQPPKDWAKFDYTNPSTDFQLQQGLKVVRSMAGLSNDKPFPIPLKKSASLDSKGKNTVQQKPSNDNKANSSKQEQKQPNHQDKSVPDHPAIHSK
ncbi:MULTISPECIES: S41 family peptidase [unclassified Commensalibacter]|uniref:S41 family peptidase n=1 Tax=unclassified Commensalibacter TaxID=2630218 RepID=UPI0018DD041D|nr:MULTISPECIES: S41 family peptidase [unclassified Commensalibacter]MBH9969227.1 S41 family peptidase [Commensalibacter sp. M0265]MBH9976582.1 S41 family peptidase [Commensalibacter sp. M0266]MBH9992481.1 S41 family peptidase [Commensalibacter sp. M0270]MBI0045758.1 S41 family peptidase [Commensalibacter sp. M0267]MBI0055427.1 S41 family peptidase [Commensalibacter sp. M0268]